MFNLKENKTPKYEIAKYLSSNPTYLDIYNIQLETLN